MSHLNYPSNRADQFPIRMPEGLRDRIKMIAASNRRSMNAEIIFHLERIYPAPSAAGEGFADTAPAAQNNHAALAGGASINQGL